MKIRTKFSFLLGAATGAAVMYLLDPETGERRRRESAERARDLADQYGVSDQIEYQANRAKGVAAEAAGSVTPTDTPNAQTLIERVRSQVLGHADVNAGEINVDAAGGVVTLRGEVASREQIESLVSATRGVDGVEDVVNLLHLPDERAASTSSGAGDPTTS